MNRPLLVALHTLLCGSFFQKVFSRHRSVPEFARCQDLSQRRAG
jgi:hypothetical protein